MAEYNCKVNGVSESVLIITSFRCMYIYSVGSSYILYTINSQVYAGVCEMMQIVHNVDDAHSLVSHTSMWHVCL